MDRSSDRLQRGIIPQRGFDSRRSDNLGSRSEFRSSPSGGLDSLRERVRGSDNRDGRSSGRRGDGRSGYRSPRDLIPGQRSRSDWPAVIGGRGGNRLNFGGTGIDISQFDNYFNQRHGFGGSRRGGWNTGGFGLGLGVGLAASNWNRYWYNNYLPRYHRSWYRGTWNWFPQGVRYVPWLYSYSNWGYNVLPYRTGYVRYYNPYWTYPASTTTVIYDYQEPIIVERPVDTSDATEQQAFELFDRALAAFEATDYSLALQHVDASLRLNPHDPAAHELRALIFFATGRYTDAAATLHALLAVAPAWDWSTMRGLYPSGAVYTDQLRALEAHRNANPQSADARFVLAYHYLVAGHTGAAERELARVVDIEPRDQVAAQILSALRAESAEYPQGDQSVAQAAGRLDAGAEELLPPSDPVPADLQDDSDAPLTPLPGRWRAEPEEGLRIELVMDAESSFTWTARDEDRTHVIEGEYSVNGPLLILEDENGEAMLARLVPETEDRFRFVLLGGPEDDPGLVFHRQ